VNHHTLDDIGAIMNKVIPEMSIARGIFPFDKKEEKNLICHFLLCV
jgi:hypothetical protein